MELLINILLIWSFFIIPTPQFVAANNTPFEIRKEFPGLFKPSTNLKEEELFFK